MVDTLKEIPFALKFLIVIIITFGISVILTPIMTFVSKAIGAVDKPNERRVNKKPMAAIGVAKSTFAKYDRGEREPNFETLKKIAQYFQTTTDYLLGLSEVMHPDKTRQLAISVPLGYDLTSTEEEVIEIAREFLRALGTISVIPVEQKEKFTVLIEQTVQVMRYALSICDYDDLMGQETAVEMVIQSCIKLLQIYADILKQAYEKMHELCPELPTDN